MVWGSSRVAAGQSWGYFLTKQDLWKRKIMFSLQIFAIGYRLNDAALINVSFVNVGIVPLNLFSKKNLQSSDPSGFVQLNCSIEPCICASSATAARSSAVEEKLILACQTGWMPFQIAIKKCGMD
jgi:hypothetical protein